LHLWSLGVEEQFYLIWPILLVGALKFNFRLLPLIVLGITISFSVNLYIAYTNPVADFYSPVTRFWEFLIRALLAEKSIFYFGCNSRLAGIINQNIRFSLGLLCLFISLCFIDSNAVFPGLIALIPVLGTALLVSAENSKLNKILFDNG
jgi:peptidoglycan/LPS O-acetylase OafA/YrhL